LRVGPWAQGETSSAGARVEGGITTHLGVTEGYLPGLGLFAPAGVLDLRAGAGYGAFHGMRSPHLTLGLAWGYRWVDDRVTWGGACDPDIEPPRVADATLVRLVTTVRRTTDFAALELGLALEVSPTVALEPARARQKRYRTHR
jgi:hypothetical protein